MENAHNKYFVNHHLEQLIDEVQYMQQRKIENNKGKEKKGNEIAM